MRVLAVDTATDAVVTGVAELSADAGVSVLADRTVTDRRRHAELLTTLIAESLAQAGLGGPDLDGVVVGCGPGPFTGLRVGLATAAAYGDALEIPVYGVCSLDAMVAQEQSAGGVIGTALAVTDARRREVYWALYRDGHRVAGPNVVAPQTLAEELAGTSIDVVVGTDGFTDRFEATPGSTQRPSVTGLVTVAASAVLARSVPEPLVPLYLRRPDAVELKDQKKRR
ncbi:tRNA (adenosine(37)-N6)-threonylcarbamoyltransferase complex dimerization subunit type 1 TsaB [Gordonia sp. TBRC 11910]|uniref:tRNA (Adenosine(37)-N6)-threonylcarbamoyltransferase complex dimerization subunit type 1 TsaB n=1 Tax=Gordonia asplenii TaxID=2725283 RepID=A0A848KVY4_9ACTN|nr:tRNA (adenosine(37)-N6)-threonylcarbamoyltransferase complex dimerization subunit type 1 TsaB [Gordonia asplenii]NMO02412.1 tRNA (adenosine(37)-N6)-threonylcarbamoyltransferase complex dimerization subunit type 1 TsaB [Gordonia asplenii]